MSKVLSVRLNEQDRKNLETLAKDLDVGSSVLARMLLHSSLTNLEGLKAARVAGRFPLSLLSELLAPEARTKGLSEEDLQRSLRSARKKLWRKHFPDLQ